MIVGFNHNVSYKGVGFHVQTEDSGVKNPQLVTLLYHDGTIISSQKTVYADILKVDNLSQVIEDLAKEQHKRMLRRLTRGEFDQRIVALAIPLGGVVSAVKSASVTSAAEAVIPTEAVELTAPQPLPKITPVVSAPVEFTPEPVTIVEEPIIDKFRRPKRNVRREPSLDELIYAYLSGADKC